MLFKERTWNQGWAESWPVRPSDCDSVSLDAASDGGRNTSSPTGLKPAPLLSSLPLVLPLPSGLAQRGLLGSQTRLSVTETVTSPPPRKALCRVPPVPFQSFQGFSRPFSPSRPGHAY